MSARWTRPTGARQLFDVVTRGGVEWRKMQSPFEKFVYPDFTFEVPDDEGKLPYLRVVTPMPNLYLTGTDVASLGIVGAMMGGVITAAYLIGPLGLFRIFGAARRLSRQRSDAAGVAAA